ncbi:fatty acid desaturase [Paenalkalicoccus suaedae]|uniref:Fatty acid desaturase n=1 Tax=Paenalkalicoccus suaedae TaxID=2592382 RepID=A0A859FGS8_9BACI|nr:fatty acid desaturase [Paenalkalicoccus suaedae]QKS72317.1 fatty acid desaturase [Paenalkalicoccus suaedae]
MSKQQQMQLRKSVQPFTSSDTKKSIWQIVNTILPFFLLWYLAYQALAVSFWLTLPITILAAFFVVRTFIIFHDCTHGSFFKNKRANKILGTITGVITHFAFEKWKRAHTIHHASSGNLDKRGIGDIWIMTVDEYNNASKLLRMQYRLYRNPLVMFGLGPFHLFLIDNRFNRRGAKKQERWNTHFITGTIAVIYALLIAVIGWQAFVLVQLPILFVSGAMGIWLFYVQHQFEDSYFENEDEWDFVKAAVDGSSYYELPKIIQWLTGNIGYHHVHHLSPKVPNYNLERTHNETEPLQKVTKVTLKTSVEAIRFRLYDEANKTFVSFKEAATRRGGKPTHKVSA